MCGLVYFHNGKAENVIRSVLKRYEAQNTRGKNGFGFVTLDLDSKQMSHYIRKETEEEMKVTAKELENERINACLFHHRIPTSTPNLADCAHPIMVDHEELDYRYYVTHNGIITNDDDLKELHEQLGYKYNTEIITKKIIETKSTIYTYPEETQFNDSEALAIELARYIDGQSSSVDARGSIAFIVLQTDKNNVATRLYYGHNDGNPLFRNQDEDLLCLKSVGEFRDKVDTDKIYSYDYTTKETIESALVLQNRFVSKDYGRAIYPEVEEERKGMFGFRTLTNSSTPPEDIEDDLPTAPDMTAREYLEGGSIIDYSIEDLLMEGWSVAELEQEAYEESYLLDELISYEEYIIGSQYKKELEERAELVNKRIGILAAMNVDEESLLDRKLELGDGKNF